MEAAELLRLAFGELHTALRDDAGSVDEATLFWQPGEGINHAGFLLWHLLRDEDTVVSETLRGAPELWATGGWPHRLGLDEGGQGTGFDASALGSIPIRSRRVLEVRGRGLGADGRRTGCSGPGGVG